MLVDDQSILTTGTELEAAATTPTRWDTACTSHAGKPDNPFIPTNQLSTKVFALADRHATSATTVAKLHHDAHKPAQTVDIVPALKGNSLLSGGKFDKAGYISICDGKEVNIYDG